MCVLTTMLGMVFRNISRDQAIPILLSAALASGQFRLVVPIGLVYLVCFSSWYRIKASISFYFLAAFCFVFLALFDRPVSLDYSYLTRLWILGLVVSALIAFVFGCGSKSFKEAQIRLFWVVMVAFCFCALSVLATLILMSPPYYGQVFDLFRWGGFGSGSRVSDLMLLTPIFLCGMLVSFKKMTASFYFVSTISVVSILMGFVLEKRIFFIMVFLILPVLFLLFKKNATFFKKLIIIIVVLFLFLLFSYVFYDQMVEKFFLEYSRNGGRLWLYESFFQQLANRDVTHVATPRSMTDAPLWFHNIFMDVYRISGPWAALSLIGLFVAFVSRLLALSRIQPMEARVITCWFIPLFIISNVSVVPEGEPQFFLLMVFLMGVTERMLHQTDFGNARSV